MSAEYEIDMSVESIPFASEVVSESESESEVQEEVQLLTLEVMMEHLPSMDPQELLELMAAVNTVLKKKWKSSPTKKSVEKVKKPAPKALKRNQAWIAFTLKHAMDNGWEAYTIHQETKNKTTGETVPDDTARSGSVPNNADTPYTFKDAKTGAIVTPAFIYEDTGKHFIYKEAMSLSAQWKWTEGARPAMKFRDETEEQEHWSDLFREFIAGYEDADLGSEASSSSSSSSSSSTPSSPVGRRLTAAEREEERAEKRRIAEEEKEVKRQAREEKKEESRQKKEQEEREKEARRLEREAKKAEKDRLELEKKAEKEKKAEAKKSPPAAAVLVKRSPVPAATASKASTSTASTATKTVVPAAKTPAPASAKAATAAPAPVKAVTTKAATATATAKAAAPKQLKPKMIFDIEEDSMVHEWTWEGKTYLVNSDKCVWEKTADGEAGEWVGMVDLEKEIIDTSVPEPDYEDDE